MFNQIHKHGEHARFVFGPLVYRLGHAPFTGERRVRFSYGLLRTTVSPANVMSTITVGSRVHHPQPGPRENSDEAVKIGARRVLHHYQRYCVVPLRKELLELRIKDKFIWATYNTEDFSSSNIVRWSLETFGNVEWPQDITRQVKQGVITLCD